MWAGAPRLAYRRTDNARLGELMRSTIAPPTSCGTGKPDVDLVIRTSDEQRISNYMLWQVAYAEWIFPPELWPDFGTEPFLQCLDAFSRRQRRFGTRPQLTANVPTGANLA